MSYKENEKKRIVIIDLIGASGHVNWLKKLVSIIQIRFEIVFISYESYCVDLGIKSFIPLDNKYLKYKNKYEFVINQIKVISDIKKILKQYDIEIPIFISGFENISYGIFGFRKRKVFLHMHSNTDKSRFSMFFLKLVDEKTSFIVYEDYIKIFMRKFKNQTYILNHTLNYIPQKNSYIAENIIFVPSKINDLRHIDQLIPFAINNNLKIIFRSDIIVSTNIITSNLFFDDYQENFLNSKYIGLYAPYNYRIAGIFYEAMLFNKNIITIGNEGIFIRKMKEDYPYSFIDISDNKNKWMTKNAIYNKNIENIAFLNKHADSTIEEQFYSIIFGNN